MPRCHERALQTSMIVARRTVWVRRRAGSCASRADRRGRADVISLRSRGSPVEYLRYEDEGHGLVKLANRLSAYPAIAEFLERHLGGAEAARRAAPSP